MTQSGHEDDGSDVRTFLIADVRGYTRFTQTRGDEEAGKLAARFAALVEMVVTQRGGRLLELRGDEALVVFVSPRSAIRSALDLQARFVEETLEDPTLPFGVGIGIDSGEAVAVQDGYRGGALNMAARLCSLAGPGEVLATGEATHLARRIDGVTYADRGRVQLKGIDEPPRVMRVSPVDDDPTADPAFRTAVLTPPPGMSVTARRQQRRRLIAVGAVLAVVLAGGVVYVGTRSTSHGLPEIGSNAIGAVSIKGNKLHRTVPVGGAPGPIAADANAVWVANTGENTVTRIDLRDKNAPANTIKVGSGPTGIAIAPSGVWVTAANDRRVQQINEASRTIVGSVRVGTGASAIASGGGRLWVTNLIDDTVSVIDAAKARVIATIPVGAQPSAVAYGFDSVWVANSGSSTVLRIDPKSLGVTAAIAVGNGPEGVTIDPTGVWVANALDDTVSHIDPQRNSVVATVGVGKDPTNAAASGDAVWVTNTNSDTISRIDPTKNRVVDTITVGNAPQAVAVTKGDAWVSAHGSARKHVGGVLRIITGDDDLDSFDPGVAYSTFGWTVIAATNDGLVTYRRTPGPTGAQVVPDLAVQLPIVSDEGKTYAFRLRSGIHYSDGSLVKPTDFRTSMERVFRLAPELPGFYTGIVGSTSCTQRRCDLSKGIVADDAAGTITVHLSTADPEFLYKLALPSADFMPPNTPLRDQHFGPHGGTGPYVVSSHVGKVTVLTRNKFYRPWSSFAQPAGYPDRIEITVLHSVYGSQAPADIAAVVKGQYDWTPDQMPSEELASLVRTHTEQLHPFALGGTHYYALNTREPPFTDVRVRKAVNFAVDRNALIDAFGGPLLAQPTCQVVPPTISGYQPYCPYTLHPNSSGRWTAPDLTTARKLIREAHATGAKVTVVARPDKYGLGDSIVAAMRSIGLDAKVFRFPDRGEQTGPLYFNYVNNLTHHVQASLGGWAIDYPEPSNILNVLFSCSAIVPDGPQNLNAAAFCDHGIDAEMARALQLQATDGAAAGALWARVDHEITDQAPWISLENDREYDVLSNRTGDYQRTTQFGVLISQLWVQ